MPPLSTEQVFTPSQSSLRLSVGVILFLPFLPFPPPSWKESGTGIAGRYYRRFVLKAAYRTNGPTNDREREIAEKFSKRCRNLTRFCRRSKRRRKRAGDNRRDGVLSARWHEDNGIRRAVPIDRIDARAVVDLYLGQRDYFLQRWGEEDANSVQFERIPIIRHVCTNTILERKLYAIIVLRGKIKKDTPSTIGIPAETLQGEKKKWNYEYDDFAG